MHKGMETQLSLWDKELIFLYILDILHAARHAKIVQLSRWISTWPLHLLATQKQAWSFYVLSYLTKGQQQQAVRLEMTNGGSLVTSEHWIQ